MDPTLFSSRPSRILISLPALRQNFLAVKTYVAPAEVLCVVKANAFGHGITECSLALQAAGATWFGVALVEEGILLRKVGITARILVFGGLYNAQVEQFLQHDLDLTASSVFKLRQIDSVASQVGKRARVHLEFDSGMGRIGVRPETAPTLILAAKECKNCDIVGAYSHLSSADDSDGAEFTKGQITKFRTIAEQVKAAFGERTLCHISNSAGIAADREARLDLVRPGLLLYGSCPGEKPPGLTLEPVLSLRTKIVYVKTVPAGTPISYGRTWISPEECRIVTLPIGYGDGYLRALSNKAEVLIRGKRYPIVGRICMDQLMVNVGKDEAFNGDDVMLIGTQEGERITAEELADWANTTTHEIFVMLNNRLPREY